MNELILTSESLEDTVAIGARIGQQLRGGEIIELVSDLGGGKTQLVRGLAAGMGSTDQVQSPTFTISRIYTSKTLELHHFDFYRLGDPGIVALELAEVMQSSEAVVAIEWADTVHGILPKNRVLATITSPSETVRVITFHYPPVLDYLFKPIQSA